MWLELLMRLLPLIPKLKSDVDDAIRELESDDTTLEKVSALLKELEELAEQLRAAFPAAAKTE